MGLNRSSFSTTQDNCKAKKKKINYVAINLFLVYIQRTARIYIVQAPLQDNNNN